MRPAELTTMARLWLNRSHIADRTPLRTVGAPEDIAHAILYLASGLSAFVTGADILVDGGLISVINL
ncbi:SDR family oxidoreductase [Catenulispora rubra]|uniref:SDR family oxidoreductase n=1 Tax=Catenulispora rubra TaxID=280293 RepID=UPI0018926496|nr:SDR family oxidoreductase [Catenulispora rubra]